MQVQRGTRIKHVSDHSHHLVYPAAKRQRIGDFELGHLHFRVRIDAVEQGGTEIAPGAEYRLLDASAPSIPNNRSASPRLPATRAMAWRSLMVPARSSARSSSALPSANRASSSNDIPRPACARASHRSLPIARATSSRRSAALIISSKRSEAHCRGCNCSMERNCPTSLSGCFRYADTGQPRGLVSGDSQAYHSGPSPD